MHPFHLMLLLFAVAALAGLILVLRWERQQYHARGLAGSWLMVRLASIPAAFAMAALVVIPARSTSGMEGLAVFYLLLVTVAPLFWFGVHWMVGRLVRPQLSFGDSARIAGTPILYIIVLAMVAAPLQSLAWSLLRSLGIS